MVVVVIEMKKMVKIDISEQTKTELEGVIQIWGCKNLDEAIQKVLALLAAKILP